MGKLSRKAFLRAAVKPLLWGGGFAIGPIVAGCHSRPRVVAEGDAGAKRAPAARVDRTFEAGYGRLQATGELKRRGQQLWEIMRSCSLCPRQCGTARLDGTRGFCGASASLETAAHHPHFGEERSLVGTGGSGTVFFSNCSMRCVFCINWQISQGGARSRTSVDRLADMMLDLQAQGCHNINIVTPTHYAPHLLLALDAAAAQGLNLPLVYNTSGFERTEILRMLDGVVDIYLPDF